MSNYYALQKDSLCAQEFMWCMFVYCLNQLQIASFVAVAWARPKVWTSSLSPAQATAVVAKEVVAQGWCNVTFSKM